MVKSRKRINPRRKTPTPKTPRPKKQRNYAATDLTRVNLRAARKRLDLIQMDLDALSARVTNLEAAQPTPAPETGTLL